MKHFKHLCMLLTTMLLSINVWGATTVEKTVNDLVTANSWTVSSGSTINTLATNFSLDEVISISTSGSANCGSIWGTTTYDWRLYQAQSGDVTITAASGYELVSAKIIYSVSNTGTLKDGSDNVASNTDITLSGSSKTFTVGNTGTKTNGQVRITKFIITYKATSGSSETAA